MGSHKKILWLAALITVSILLLLLKLPNQTVSSPCIDFQLIRAYETENLRLFGYCLSKGGNPNSRIDGTYYSLLQSAVAKNQTSYVNLLLSYSANPNVQSLYSASPVYIAALNENEDILKKLLSSQGFVYTTPPGDQDILADKKRFCNKNIRNLIEEKSKSDLEIFLLKEKILAAIEDRDFLSLENALGALKKAGGSTEFLGFSSISSAISKKDFEIISFLISQGIDPCVADEQGEFPAFSAYKMWKNKEYRFLLLACNNPNLKTDFGQTLMHLAVKYEDTDEIKFLLQAGATLNEPDNTGKTPLDYLSKKIESELSSSEFKIFLTENNESCL